MSEATAAKPPPEPSPTDALLMQGNRLLRQALSAVREDIEGQGETVALSEMNGRLAEMEHALRSLAGAITIEQARVPVPAAEAVPERRRRRASRQRPAWPEHLRPVRALTADAPALGGAVVDTGSGDGQVTVTWTGLAG